jgi:glycosyltransferase involved in cell wall biosynthesis
MAMRIAYLINQYPHVSHTFIRREIFALEKRGFTIMRIAIRGWNTELPDQADRMERERTRYVLRDGFAPLALATARMLVTHPIRLARATATAWQMSRDSGRALPVHLAYVAEACRIADWLRKSSITHVHAHFGTNSAEVAMLLHVLGGPRWSFTAHGTETFDNPRQVGLAEKIRRCAFAVAISSYGQTQMHGFAEPELRRKIHVVRCGLDMNAFETTTATLPRPRRLVCVARLSPEKGHRVLLEAAGQLAKKGDEFELVLAGDGGLRAELEAQIVRQGLTGKVHITGWLSSDEVRHVILSARALVLSSFAEGLPVVLMEAMALRRPVIATLVGGIPELVQNDENGWLIPAGDVAALANAMRACLDASPDTIARMGEAARERVLSCHNVDISAEQLDLLFRQSGSPHPA